MKTHFKVCLLFIFLFYSFAGKGQTIKELAIGDNVPDLEIGEIINYSKKSINTSDFKDKLLILDFWTTTCIPCLASFPKLDSLQNEYSSNLQILSVTNESKAKAGELLAKLQKAKKIIHPSVVGDSLLRKMFPYDVVPHVVWIKNSKVIAITGGDEITKSNIASILQGAAVNFQVKKDFQSTILSPQSTMTFVPSVHVADGNDIKLKPLGSDKLLFNSVLTRSVDNFPHSIEYSDLWLLARNVDPASLLKVALWGGKSNMFNAQSTICEITDSTLRKNIGLALIEIRDRAILQKLTKDHTFCYEIYVPQSMTKQKYDIMLNDLNQYFRYAYGIEGVMEKRNQKCLVLTLIGGGDKLKSKGGDWIGESNAYWIKIQNGNIRNLLGRLIQPLQLYPPLIDETNYTGNIDIELNCELTNLEALNQELAKYGLKLEEKEKMLDVGVIRMKK